MDAVKVDVGLDLDELEQENVELLPARQTLSCHHGGYGSYYNSLHLGLGLELSLVSSGRGW